MQLLSKSYYYLLGLILPITILVSSCYPGDSAFDIDDLDLVLTLRNETFDFQQNKTYAMPDSIVTISGRILLPNEFDEVILQRIAENMEDYGYTRILNPDEANPPDVILLVSKSATEVVEAYASNPLWWDSWGWYPGWNYYGPGYGPGWYPAYPWYGGGAVYNYTVGTLLIDMLDATPNEADQELNSVWAAGINGLLEGDAFQSRIEEAIDQSFDQSPYLD